MDLFHSAPTTGEPLAARMRPRTLDDFIGQEHILGPGRLLRRAIQADQLSSLIFYGPPGTGKTTLAMVIANTTESRFDIINAVLSGVKQIRESIDKASEQRDLYGRRTILFVDEVHRWNKAQQDALLPWVENGTVILIGATTQNPFFEVNSALVSRSRIFQLKPLTRDSLTAVAEAALRDRERGYGKYRISINDDALAHLVDTAGGDARTLLNALELAVETTPEQFPPRDGEEIIVTLAIAEESIQKRAVLYDKEGDYHFDTISAFIKSIRGSDPDAALYWMARMVRAGEDPKYIFRRMLISASEDIGLADPKALEVTLAAAQAFDRIGLPEGQFHLAQATLYLATAPKSNSALAYFDALKSAEEEENSDVPSHLKDSNRDKKGFGHGEGYLYPHAYTDHWVAQQYLPGTLQGRIYYTPSDQGYEASIRESVLRRREAQVEASFPDQIIDVCSYTPPDRKRDTWIDRTMSGLGPMLEKIRDAVFGPLSINRSDRILDTAPGSGMIALEALRRSPEGGVYLLTPESQQQTFLADRFSALPEAERPVLIRGDIESWTPEKGLTFEFILGRNPVTRITSKKDFFLRAGELMSDRGILSIAQTVPSMGDRLSGVYLDQTGREDDIYLTLIEAEEKIYSDPVNPLTSWNGRDLVSLCEQSGLTIIRNTMITTETQRSISRELLSRWFDPGSEFGYGVVIARKSGKAVSPDRITEKLASLFTERRVSWRHTHLLLTAQKLPVG